MSYPPAIASPLSSRREADINETRPKPSRQMAYRRENDGSKHGSPQAGNAAKHRARRGEKIDANSPATGKSRLSETRRHAASRIARARKRHPRFAATRHSSSAAAGSRRMGVVNNAHGAGGEPGAARGGGSRDARLVAEVAPDGMSDWPPSGGEPARLAVPVAVRVSPRQRREATYRENDARIAVIASAQR